MWSRTVIFKRANSPASPRGGEFAFPKMAPNLDSCGRRPWIEFVGRMSRVAAKESSAATRLIFRQIPSPRPSAVATFFRRYAAEERVVKRSGLAKLQDAR